MNRNPKEKTGIYRVIGIGFLAWFLIRISLYVYVTGDYEMFTVLGILAGIFLIPAIIFHFTGKGFVYGIIIGFMILAGIVTTAIILATIQALREGKYVFAFFGGIVLFHAFIAAIIGYNIDKNKKRSAKNREMGD